jgi:hypothetical protein
MYTKFKTGGIKVGRYGVDDSFIILNCSIICKPSGGASGVVSAKNT